MPFHVYSCKLVIFQRNGNLPCLISEISLNITHLSQYPSLVFKTTKAKNDKEKDQKEEEVDNEISEQLLKL